MIQEYMETYVKKNVKIGLSDLINHIALQYHITFEESRSIVFDSINDKILYLTPEYKICIYS